MTVHGSGPARSRCSKPSSARTARCGFHPPREFADTFDRTENGLAPGLVLNAPDGHVDAIVPTAAPSAFRLVARFDIAPHTSECGILLRTSEDGDDGYVVRLEPRRGRMVFDRWPRRSTGSEQWQISGDVPFAVELERPAEIARRRAPAGDHRRRRISA